MRSRTFGRHPTGERSRYVCLRFDFSEFRNAPQVLEASFEEHCAREIRLATERHPDLFPEEAARAILAPPSVNGKLGELFAYAAACGIPLYVLIDFLSLLYYFGLLGIREASGGLTMLGIPNQTVRQLLYGCATPTGT